MTLALAFAYMIVSALSQIDLKLEGTGKSTEAFQERHKSFVACRQK